MQFTTTFVAVVAAMATAVTAAPTSPVKPAPGLVHPRCNLKPNNTREINGSTFNIYRDSSMPCTLLHQAEKVQTWGDCLKRCTKWNENPNHKRKCDAVTWNHKALWCRIKTKPNKCTSRKYTDRHSAILISSDDC